MISNLSLHYPNVQKVEFDKVFSFKILSLNKEYLFYSLGEVNNNMLTLYFGELKEQNGKMIMEGIKNEDIEVFRQFLIALANNKVTVTDPNYAVTTLNLENKEIEVTGGQKTSLNIAVVTPFLTGLSQTVKVEEPAPEIMRENPHVEVTPTNEGVKVAVEQVSEAEEKTPVVEVKEPVDEKKEVPPTKEEPKEEVKPKKKKNVAVIILAILVVIILAAGCVFGYLWIKDNNQKADQNNQNNQNNQEGTGISLEQLATNFSNSEFVSTLRESYESVNVATTTNELVVTIVGTESTEYRMQLSNHILSLTIPQGDEIGRNIGIGVYVSLQELLGNDREEVQNMIESDTENTLTLSNDGISFTTLDDGSIYEQMDMRTKLTVRDLSRAITKEELEADRDYLTGNGSINYQRGNLYYHKTMVDGQPVITVVQEGTLSDLAYQSIVNTISVLFDEAEAADFETQYTDLATGNASLTGYEIEINGTLPTSLDVDYDEATYDWVVVTITKSLTE